MQQKKYSLQRCVSWLLFFLTCKKVGVVVVVCCCFFFFFFGGGELPQPLPTSTSVMTLYCKFRSKIHDKRRQEGTSSIMTKDNINNTENRLNHIELFHPNGKFKLSIKSVIDSHPAHYLSVIVLTSQ